MNYDTGMLLAVDHLQTQPGVKWLLQVTTLITQLVNLPCCGYLYSTLHMIFGSIDYNIEVTWKAVFVMKPSLRSREPIQPTSFTMRGENRLSVD